MYIKLKKIKFSIQILLPPGYFFFFFFKLNEVKYENKVTIFPKHFLIALRMQPFPSQKNFMVENIYL